MRRRAPASPAGSTCRARTTAAMEAGHGDEEDRRPAQRSGEHSTGQDPGRSAHGRGGAPEAHGPRSRLTGEGQQEQGHGGRAERRSTEPLDDAPGDQHLLVRGGRSHQGPEREHGRAGDEHPTTAQQVCEASRQEQETAEHQDVGVDHPGEAGGGQPEVVLDGRERHVDDRGVEHHDELRGDQERERHGAAACRGGAAQAVNGCRRGRTAGGGGKRRGKGGGGHRRRLLSAAAARCRNGGSEGAAADRGPVHTSRPRSDR